MNWNQHYLLKNVMKITSPFSTCRCKIIRLRYAYDFLYNWFYAKYKFQLLQNLRLGRTLKEYPLVIFVYYYCYRPRNGQCFFNKNYGYEGFGHVILRNINCCKDNRIPRIVIITLLNIRKVNRYLLDINVLYRQTPNRQVFNECHI